MHHSWVCEEQKIRTQERVVREREKINCLPIATLPTDVLDNPEDWVDIDIRHIDLSVDKHSGMHSMDD